MKLDIDLCGRIKIRPGYDKYHPGTKQMKIMNAHTHNAQKRMIIDTDPTLPPKIRYCRVINEYLQNDGFGYLKSKNTFVKKTSSGKMELRVSFVNTINLIHGVGFSFHYIFDDIELEFQRLFGKIWTNWTVYLHLGYVNTVLYENSGYTDNSINNAVTDFLHLVYPRVRTLEQRFGTKEKLVSEFISAPDEPVDFVPIGRLERRVLMCLMLTKMFRAEDYHINLVRSKMLLEKYKGSDKAEHERRIRRGIEILG